MTIFYQRVLFTVLPHGPDPDVAGRYHASVYISPRLTTDSGGAVLNNYPDWKNWPVVVNGIDWSMVFAGGSPLPATVVSPAARSDLWQALFNQGALVKPYKQTSFKNRRIVSYPAKNILSFLLDLYTKTAVNHSDDFPPFSVVSNFLGGLAPGSGGEIPFDAIVEGLLDENGAITNGAPEPGVDFAQLRRFHRSRVTLPKISDQIKPNYTPLPPPTKPTLDFHQAVSAVGQYPPLMRLLGLVVDLTFDIVSGPPASPNTVQVIPGYTPSGDGPPGGGVIGRVRTRCLIDSDTFEAAPSTTAPELVDGRLPLEDSDRYTVIQEDIDGGGLKNTALAGNLARLASGPDGLSPASPQEYALPSLRSGGLSVARFNLAPRVKNELDKAADNTEIADGATPEDLLVDAEELVRGYRIDIFDGLEGKWFSLLGREGSYKFPGNLTVPYTDEGWVTEVPTEDEAEDLYLQESIFGWDGWSLAAPRPGGRINTVKAPAVTNAPNTPDPDFPVEVTKKVPAGSLPRLRYERLYSIRARAVDLAGNSVDAPATGADPHGSNRLTYLRYEPITSPPVLLHKPRTQGESLERVVLRSNYNTDPSPAQVYRHIVPPKTDQMQAEHHGLFDSSYPGSKLSKTAYSTISAYPGETEPVPGPVLQSEQGNFNSDNQGELDETDMKKIRFFDVPLVQLPYLPDPLARGAALFFQKIEQVPSFQMLKAPFTLDPAWPNYRPWRLVVEGYGEVPQVPFLREEDREIHVQLAKAETAVVRLSCYPDEPDLEKLGIWNLIVENGQNVGGLKLKVLFGRHWMITPYRTLTLVHAVRQPLRIADFVTQPPNNFGIQTRSVAETAIRFKGRILLDINSTSRIDLVASWDEYIDEGPGTPEPIPPAEAPRRRTIAISIPSGRGQTPAFPSNDPQFVALDQEEDRQEFGDTKRRDITYTTVATTAFAEYFTQSVNETITYSGGSKTVVLPDEGQGGIVPGSVKVKNLVTAEETNPNFGSYVEGVHFTVTAAIGEIKFTSQPAGAVPNGRQVVITYLVPPIVRPWRPETMVPAEIVVPSTAVPAPPKPIYLIPTFDWSLSRNSNQITSSRKGLGLRVYLERPWWTSGKGELLGVVLLTGVAGPEQRTSKATQWGVDPVFKSVPITNQFPTLVNFGEAAETATLLPVPGGLGLYDVAGFEVGFDADRDLWYSDIVVGTFSYFPFIRLALARFQPRSIDGAHLSEVVVVDFAQLTPDRLVTVLPGNNASRRRVNVSGTSFEKQGVETGPIIRATVEKQDQNTDLGWTQLGNPVTLTRTSSLPLSSSWTGQVTVQATGGGLFGLNPPPKQRIVIEELERHRTRTDSGSTQTAERLVFSDVIEL